MSMTINSMANQSLANDMLKLSTAKRINSAADDAAGLSIAQSLTATAKGLQTGTDNADHMANLANTAEGGLSSASDMLGRMRDLALQASNGILSRDDKAAIQNEIDQLKEGLHDVFQNTQYNSMNLLDGSFTDKQVASNPDGSGMNVSFQAMSLQTLGIANFDVTRNFDVNTLDRAISSVSDARSSIGSITNALGHVANANKNAYINEISSLSRIQDTNMAETISNMQKNKVIEQMSVFTAQKQNEQVRNRFMPIL